MIQFIFTKKAKKKFVELAKNQQQRIIAKLQYASQLEEPNQTFFPLKNMLPATHRLRIGSYRLLLELSNFTTQKYIFRILKLAHRRDIYK